MSVDEQPGPEPDKPETSRANRQAANLARHLNDRYPDTALFLARYAAGRVDVTAAQFASVGCHNVVLNLQVGSSTETTSLEMPGATTDQSAGEPRLRLRQLLATTRSALPAGSDAPITSLEAMLVDKTGPAGDVVRTDVPARLHQRLAKLHEGRLK